MDPEDLTEATRNLLEQIASKADVANDFSDWAIENQVGPLELLSILQTMYVYLRTNFAESVTVMFMAYVTMWTEHLLHEHPDTFGYPDLGLVGSPIVGEDDDPGAGVQMLNDLAHLMGEENGAS